MQIPKQPACQTSFVLLSKYYKTRAMAFRETVVHARKHMLRVGAGLTVAENARSYVHE
jgi:hypothetical protein